MDKHRLFYEMRKRGIKTKELCDFIGMSVTTFSRKCNGKSEFTIPEVNKILEYLGLNSPMGIFF